MRCPPNHIHKWHHLTIVWLPAEQAWKLWKALLYPADKAELTLSASLAGGTLFLYPQMQLWPYKWCSLLLTTVLQWRWRSWGNWKITSRAKYLETHNSVGKPCLKHRFPHSSPMFFKLYQSVVLPSSIGNLLMANNRKSNPNLPKQKSQFFLFSLLPSFFFVVVVVFAVVVFLRTQ